MSFDYYDDTIIIKKTIDLADLYYKSTDAESKILAYQLYQKAFEAQSKKKTYLLNRMAVMNYTDKQYKQNIPLALHLYKQSVDINSTISNFTALKGVINISLDSGLVEQAHNYYDKYYSIFSQSTYHDISGIIDKIFNNLIAMSKEQDKNIETYLSSIFNKYTARIILEYKEK
jgi:hypothetical protein